MKAERVNNGVGIYLSRTEAERLSAALQKKTEGRGIEEEYLLKDVLIALEIGSYEDRIR